MIDLLDDVFGPYPFEAYGVLVVDEDLGFALETQTLTIIGVRLAAGGAADEILLHELAHQWVGDAVSPATWQDIWLNEGFATYAEWLWLERTGRTVGRRQRPGSTTGVAELDRAAGRPGRRRAVRRHRVLRGGMTLQALRERVGDDAFFEILRTWVDEHRDEHGVHRGLRRAGRAGQRRGARRPVRRLALRATGCPPLTAR